MKHTRKTTALLALLLLAASCTAACVDAQTDVTPDAPQTTSAVTEAVTEEAEKIILDAIPEGTDLAGKQIRIRINTFDQTQFGSEIFMRRQTEISCTTRFWNATRWSRNV